MLAWEIARAWWRDHSTVPFEERLGWHLSCGLVYSTHSAFMLASEERWDPEKSEIRKSGNQEIPNAWFVELAVLQSSTLDARPSTLDLLLRVAPHPHDWVLFRRNNGFRIHACRWERFARKVGYQPLSPIT
jgi:hypothetical protein